MNIVSNESVVLSDKVILQRAAALKNTAKFLSSKGKQFMMIPRKRCHEILQVEALIGPTRPTARFLFVLELICRNHTSRHISNLSLA